MRCDVHLRGRRRDGVVAANFRRSERFGSLFRVRGTRGTVGRIGVGSDVEQILDDYLYLEREDVIRVAPAIKCLKKS